MANKEDYLARLQVVIMQLHNCGAIWSESVPVREMFNGKTLWSGEVEVFDLFNHPKAKRCYGWSYGEPEEFVTVLELPPVTDAQNAVRLGVAYQIKKSREK
ncbi:MAG TPA: hypothetical protein VMA35_00145 [Candidatus Sulfopaludibacter sp.]|nr:hypothetical protein [Candidatus Sulfopaludibacter sp.]